MGVGEAHDSGGERRIVDDEDESSPMLIESCSKMSALIGSSERAGFSMGGKI
jgi:hypothetical protein